MNQQFAVCIADGCNLPARARQRCNTHYHAWRRSNLNEVGAPGGDPRMGWCRRLSELLDEAPDGVLSNADRALINTVAFTAVSVARGVLPISPETRIDLLHKAVDSLGAEVAE